MSLRKVVFIGAGNVASHLASALERSGAGEVIQVYSRTVESASELASVLHGAEPVTDIASLRKDADVYIVSLKDDAIAAVLSQVSGNNALWLHTSGSVGMEVLSSVSPRYGVFYPLQTFSKDVAVDISNVPLFVESSDESVEKDIFNFAAPTFKRVYHADSNTRRMMHIAAVFGCNFVNYLWTLASDILSRENLPLDVLKPLLEETLKKAFVVGPENGQTGPAVRGDRKIINNHLSLLDGQEHEIYNLLSESIMSRYNRK